LALSAADSSPLAKRTPQQSKLSRNCYQSCRSAVRTLPQQTPPPMRKSERGAQIRQRDKLEADHR
jgi:hypothetical protein